MDQWNVGEFLFVAHMCDPGSAKLPYSRVNSRSHRYWWMVRYIRLQPVPWERALFWSPLTLEDFGPEWRHGDTGVIDCSERVCTNILCGFTLLKISSTTGDFLEHQPDNLKRKDKSPFFRWISSWWMMFGQWFPEDGIGGTHILVVASVIYFFNIQGDGVFIYMQKTI